LAYLKPQQYGHSSEQLSEKIAQLELTLEDLEAAATTAPVFLDEPAGSEKSTRRPLPAYFINDLVSLCNLYHTKYGWRA
jgi:hypothetical protein